MRPKEIISGYAASLTGGVGQFCTNPGALILPELPDDAVTQLREELTSQPRFSAMT